MTIATPYRRLDRIEAPVPNLGTKTSCGGLYLNQDEHRWFRELMSRIELLHVRRSFYQGAGERAHEYAYHAAQDARMGLATEIAKRAFNEIGFEGDPETSSPVARVQTIIINRGMPATPMAGYFRKTVDLLDKDWVK